MTNSGLDLDALFRLADLLELDIDRGAPIADLWDEVIEAVRFLIGYCDEVTEELDQLKAVAALDAVATTGVER